MSHIHFVSNESAKSRLLQMGEVSDNVFTIGSPDLDIMTSDSLPSIVDVKSRYGFDFDSYAVFMYHPVTTEPTSLQKNISQVVDALISSAENYIVIFPNNDQGSDTIIEELKRLRGNERFRIYPSIRFECFLTIIKNGKFMVGNSSAGVREVPFYGIPTINIGTRQNNRANSKTVMNVGEDSNSILEAIQSCEGLERIVVREFGDGSSDEKFLSVIESDDVWQTKHQKVFVDRL